MWFAVVAWFEAGAESAKSSLNQYFVAILREKNSTLSCECQISEKKKESSTSCVLGKRNNIKKIDICNVTNFSFSKPP